MVKVVHKILFMALLCIEYEGKCLHILYSSRLCLHLTVDFFLRDCVSEIFPAMLDSKHY